MVALRKPPSVLARIAEDVTVMGGEPVVRGTRIPADGRASYEETRYLLQSPANAERLLGSIAELEKGGGAEKTLDE